MCASLRPWLCLSRHCNAYDVNGQYRKKFKTHLAELVQNFPELSTIQIRHFWTLPRISKFYAPAHTASFFLVST